MTTTSTRISTPPKSTAIRLPMVRNRSRLIGGAALIALCAFVLATAFANAGDRTQVLVLARDVEVGQPIQRSDLRPVGIAANDTIKTIPLASASSVVGKTATTRLSAGSVLASDQVADSPALMPGQAIVGALLKPGQYPTSLQVNDRVSAFVTDTQDAAAPPVAAVSAVVRSIEPTGDGSGSTVVSLIIDNAVSSAIAPAASAGRVSLVVVGK